MRASQAYISEKVRQCCERVKTVWVDESDERKLPVIVTESHLSRIGFSDFFPLVKRMRYTRERNSCSTEFYSTACFPKTVVFAQTLFSYILFARTGTTHVPSFSFAFLRRRRCCVFSLARSSSPKKKRASKKKECKQPISPRRRRERRWTFWFGAAASQS